MSNTVYVYRGKKGVKSIVSEHTYLASKADSGSSASASAGEET